MTEVRAFSRNREQTAWLLKHGVPDKAIYQVGRGAEDFDECMATFRGRPGKLVIAHDLRIFGLTKKDVAATMARLEKARIRVVDISHPADTTIAAMLQTAFVLISRARFQDKRTARRRGRDGGLGNGRSAEHARAVLAQDWVIRNIVNDPEIPWRSKVGIFDGKISASSMRRHFREQA